MRFFHTGRVCALALIVCAGLAWPTPAEAKRKDDRMVLSNGDQIVGEIKSVAQGELLFKPEYVLSSMSVDWRMVRELHSQDRYHVKLSTGMFATGTIERRADGSFLVNVTGGQTITTIWQDVVAMSPAESSFWAQLTGDINSGFSYTSGINQTQFSASGALGYSTERYTFHADGSSTFSGQSDGSSTSRNTLTVLNALILKPRVYAGILTDFLNSQQQDLDLRTTVGGAVGRWLVLTDKTEVTIFGGAVYTHERVLGASRPGATWIARGEQRRGGCRARIGIFPLQDRRRPVAAGRVSKPDDARPRPIELRADVQLRDCAEPVLELHAVRELRLAAPGQRAQERLRDHELHRVEVLTTIARASLHSGGPARSNSSRVRRCSSSCRT